MKTAIEANLNAVLSLERPKKDVASVALDSGMADRRATDNGPGSLQIVYEPWLPLGVIAIIAPGHGNATVRDFTD